MSLCTTLDVKVNWAIWNIPNSLAITRNVVTAHLIHGLPTVICSIDLDHEDS